MRSFRERICALEGATTLHKAGDVLDADRVAVILHVPNGAASPDRGRPIRVTGMLVENTDSYGVYPYELESASWVPLP